MSEVTVSLTKWISERPKWLQITAMRILQQSELTNKDISELSTLCQQEADGKLSKTTCSFPASAFSQDAAGSLRLCSISDVEGVNALSPKNHLSLVRAISRLFMATMDQANPVTSDSSNMYVAPASRVPFTAMFISRFLLYRRPVFRLSRTAF